MGRRGGGGGGELGAESCCKVVGRGVVDRYRELVGRIGREGGEAQTKVLGGPCCGSGARRKRGRLRVRRRGVLMLMLMLCGVLVYGYTCNCGGGYRFELRRLCACLYTVYTGNPRPFKPNWP